MKLAITDACIFIDLYDTGLITPFFELGLEVHTTFDVIQELYPVQQSALLVYVPIQKLHIHNISENERQQIITTDYPRGLSMNDKTVLFLAKHLEAMVLSSDKLVRNCAKERKIEYHGMLWIFDKLVESQCLLPSEACHKLNLLFSKNVIYRQNSHMQKEATTRIKEWSKR
jgi:hypothetical protein